MELVRSIDLRSHVLQHRDAGGFHAPCFDVVSASFADDGADELVATETTAGPRTKQASRERTRIGIVTLSGALTKGGSSLASRGSTVRARTEVRTLAADEDIDAILIQLDTPGGTVAGTFDLTADIKNARKKKPVYAFIEDLGASAGYAIASACEKIYANDAGAWIGSIGVLLGLYDMSKAAEEQGIKPMVFKFGQLKGTGFEGTEITEEQQEYLQSLVTDHGERFVAHVAAGRGKSEKHVLQNWALGRVWPASEAKSMGLIDGIQSLDKTLSSLARRSRQTLSETPTSPPAMSAPTFDDIVAACPGIEISESEDAQFLTSQQQAGHDVATVAANWAQTLKDRIGAARQEATEQREKAAQAERAKSQNTETPGVDAIEETTGGNDSAGNATDSFWSAVAEKENRGIRRARAVSQTVREDKSRHDAMLAEANA